MHTTRRQLLGTGLAAAPFFFLPQIAFARAQTDKRFVMIILRGAMDGITAVAPVGDPEYARARGDLAVAGPATIGGMFAIHPALAETAAMYNAKEALFVHAVASPYRDRSHFDGQNVLETGGTSPYELKDGWMNRLLPLLPAGQRALAVASAVPPILRGRVGVESYAPSNLGEPTDDLLHRVGLMYAGDPVLHPMWDAAIEARRIAAETGAPVAAAMPTLGAGAPAGTATMTSVIPAVARPAPTSAPHRNGNRNLPGLAALAAQFLAKPDGARIAVLESDGWDTHSGQQGRSQNRPRPRMGGYRGALRHRVRPHRPRQWHRRHRSRHRQPRDPRGWRRRGRQGHRRLAGAGRARALRGAGRETYRRFARRAARGVCRAPGRRSHPRRSRAVSRCGGLARNRRRVARVSAVFKRQRVPYRYQANNLPQRRCGRSRQWPRW